MDVSDAIGRRRALRMIDERPISNEVIHILLTAARLAPSCFNNQPWRYVVVKDQPALENVKAALSRGNAWATKAPLIIVIASRAEDDCEIKQRKYHHFDCGLSVGQLMLQATELGLIAHPIAGYSPKNVSAALGIPEDYLVINLIICGYPGDDDAMLSDAQREKENSRRERKPLEENFFQNEWGKPIEL